MSNDTSTNDPAATPPGLSDTSGAPSWTPSVLSGAPASVPATSPFVDTEGAAAGAATSPVQAPDDYTSQSAETAEAASQAATEPAPSFGHLWLQSVQDDWRHLSNILAASGVTPDQSYRLPQYGTPEWKALTQGIPEDQWSAFGNAVSAEHAQFIRQNILADLHSDQQMAQAGILKRLAVGAIDPESLALLAIPGVGEEADVGRIAKFLIGGTQLGAENAALTALQDQGKYTAGPHDVLDAAVSGFLLHGAVSVLGTAGGAALERAGFAAKRAVALNELADLVEQGKLSPEQVRPDVLQEIANGAPEGFGPDSGGAARATLNVDPAVSIDPATAPTSVSREAFSTVTGAGTFNPLKTFAGVLRGSSSAIVRSRLGRMFGSVIGAEDHSVNTVGASDYASMIGHQYETEIGRIELAHKPQWMQEKGISAVASKYSADVQHQWSADVADEIRGIDTGSQAAKAAAKKYSALFDSVRQDAKRAGVDGFETIPSNEHYLPRVFDFDKIKAVNRAIGDKGMTSFLADSLQSANPDMEREVAEAIGKGYLQRTKRLALGVDQQMLNGVRLSDVEYIREMLADTPDVDPAHVDGVINMLQRDMQKRGSDEGTLRMSKHRVQFDETHAIDVPDMGRVTMADLFSRDAHGLAHRYVRTMSGAIGLAKVGIRGDSDFRRSLNESLQSLDDAGADENEKKLVRAYAESGYKLILGRPLEANGFEPWMKVMRVLRQYAFARSMGKGFFSIASNLVRPWSYGYARYTSKYLPALRGIFTRDANADLNDELARDVERLSGLGGDSLSMSVFNHFSNTEDGMGRALDKTSHLMNVAARGTSHIGGMTPGLVFGQRIAALGILDRIVRHSFGEADLPANRLAMMGLTPDLLTRIAQQVRENAPEIEGTGQKIRSLNLTSWSDLDARDALMVAVHREARTLIHGYDLAATAPWMNSTLGRLAVQLRNFPLQALSKQLLRGIHDRDMAHAYDFMATSAVAALSTWAEAHLYSMGMGEADKAKYMAEQTSPLRLVAAALQRNPYSSFLPQLVDTITSNLPGVDRPVFDQRASGLSGGGVAGIPSVAAGENAWTALTNPFKEGWTKRSERAFMAALPLGNTLPMVALTNWMGEDLPESEPKQKSTGPKGPLLQ